MGKYGWAGALLIFGVSSGGCERANESEVRREMADLQEAKQRAPEVAKDLQQQLEQAKGKVVRLEEELAMAKQGVTREVVKEREELKQALNKQGKQVNEEIQEAEQASRAHTQDAEQASKRLQETQAQNQVKAEVRTETTVVPNAQQPEVTTQRDTTQIERARVIDQKATSAQKGNDIRSAKQTQRGMNPEGVPAPAGDSLDRNTIPETSE